MKWKDIARKAAKLIGIEPVSVWRLKERYLKHGETAFIHGNTRRTPKNKQFDYKKILSDYKLFKGTPFGSFRDDCEDYLATL